MGANFSRIKVWTSTEDVTAADLNAEFDNILQNLTPVGLDDYSSNVAQMQETADPGEVGSESLATSIAGELQRLRFMIAEITGETEWYESPASTIQDLVTSLGSGIQANRLVSGKVRTTSDQPIFLRANGASRAVTLLGATTPFIYRIKGVEYEINTDVTITGPTAAPSSNNTCVVSESTAADQEYTKSMGECGTEIVIDTIGSEITGRNGKLCAFKINNGSADEYFIAKVGNSSGSNRLTEARRGYFFNSSDVPVPRIVYTNGDTITLLRLTWIFAKTNLSLAVTYNPPVYAYDTPTSPDLGDYWFDLSTNIWKVYSGTFVDANATLIGVCIQDTTATVGTRSFEFSKNYEAVNTVEIKTFSTSLLKSRWNGSIINVWGNLIRNDHDVHVWNKSTSVDPDSSIPTTGDVYAYITEDGDTMLSQIKPYDRNEDLFGHYHPHQSWRCVGQVRVTSSNFQIQTSSYYKKLGNISVGNSVIASRVVCADERFIPVNANAGAVTLTLPDAIEANGATITVIKTDSSLANIVTINDSQGLLVDTLATSGECGEYIFVAGNAYIKSKKNNTVWESYTPVFVNFGTVVSIDFQWRKDGSDLLIRGNAVSGTTAAGIGTISLPTGLTTATAPANLMHFGHIRASNTSANTVHILSEPSATVVYLAGNNATTAGLTKTNTSTLIGTGIKFSVEARIPIAGWR